MNAETLAALERAAELCDEEAARWRETVHTRLVNLCSADAALIRAMIERERSGGERAQIVAWLEMRSNEQPLHCDAATLFYASKAIASGAHLAGPRVLSVNVVEGSGRVSDGQG